MKRPIRVLIVDDSAVVRNALASILGADPDLDLMSPAGDPFIAAERIAAEAPDVIFLDVEMPRMDGLTFLRKIMAQKPIPVVICSSLTQSGSETALKALEFGAVEIIAKPQLGARQFLEESKQLLCDAAKAAAHARIGRKLPIPSVAPKLTADAVVSKPSGCAMIETTDKVILIGASTGGTEALCVILSALPADTPGVVIVQHMPEQFTAGFAKRLDSLSPMSVKEAAHGDAVIPGRALLAPGNRHTLLKRSGARYYVEVREGPLVSRHRPSVDVLFRTGARYAGRNAVGALLTGMGDDGAQGLLEMREAGAFTIAQDEKTSVVFGMPAEAIRRDAAMRVLPLNVIASNLTAAAK
ncbi:MAG: chemotaxis response regulator protein-glutamate methylesterase [Acidobacteria bacterium]|nr:chemotaxis response regulator protein-glutamate methylesterase [Acidobacteriota bacterium]